ncbi:ADP-ribosylglycohydrolase [Litoreibacter ponti]|uniref:ADP-ribosylglycohydrolase n=2 Tax=Litoreibacter ponti TaxID=1510457 RepID=A0A2T6BNB2_9RHOB|nr:ADP-ribosylglycohydrolase [Litoreibacter ponti]
MLLGALVADAASMGLHWLYDQERIAAVAGDTPEFRTPTEADYADTKGYFAHGGKQAGALSHYGEQCLVMLRALAAAGRYDRAAYEAEFRATFGYGGTFVGYIDRPTRATLDAMAADPEGEGFHGDDDVQLPAVSKLPGVVALHGADPKIVEDAVRVTNNNDTAVAFGQLVATMMQDVLAGADPADAMHKAVAADPGKPGEAVRKALNMKGSTVEITRAIGMSCQLEYGIPSVAHNLTEARDFKHAVRTNILAGGDSCGRAIVLGAIMGAAHGVPQDWLSRLDDRAEIEALVDRICG